MRQMAVSEESSLGRQNAVKGRLRQLDDVRLWSRKIRECYVAEIEVPPVESPSFWFRSGTARHVVVNG